MKWLYKRLIEELREEALAIRRGEQAGQMDADLMAKAADVIERLIK